MDKLNNTEIFEKINEFIDTWESEEPTKIKNWEKLLNDYQEFNIDWEEAYSGLVDLIQVL